MPRKLKYLNTFLDGVSYLGVIESVTPPKLTRKLENSPGRRDVRLSPCRFRPRR
ncbi:phage major tail tube protein [Klebsiella pneumoniae subsp. pneumoniae]|nr:phage major tail tube protein [Klebsiella pneumoniae subsp. pneumoniae]